MPHYLNSQFRTANLYPGMGQSSCQESSLNEETQLSNLSKQMDLLWLKCFVNAMINQDCNGKIRMLQEDSEEMIKQSFKIKKSQKNVGELLQKLDERWVRLDENRVHVEKTIHDLEKNMATLEKQFTERADIEAQKAKKPAENSVKDLEVKQKIEVEVKQLIEKVEEPKLLQAIENQIFTNHSQVKNSDNKNLELPLKQKGKDSVHKAPSSVIPVAQEAPSKLKDRVQFIEPQHSEPRISYPNESPQTNEKKQNLWKKICQVIGNLFSHLFFYWPSQLVSYTWKKIHIMNRSLNENLSSNSSGT